MPRFNRGGSEKGERQGQKEGKERESRRNDGRKGEEGRHGEFGWGGIAPLLLGGIDATGSRNVYWLVLSGKTCIILTTVNIPLA